MVTHVVVYQLTNEFSYSIAKKNTPHSAVLYHFICTIVVFLVYKTKRSTEFQFYWYYDSTCFWQPFCPSSAALSSILLLVKKVIKLHKMYQCRCTVKNSWWWAERLPETCGIVIPIKLEFSASIGFIHKEFFTIHGHTILNFEVLFQLWLQYSAE